MKRYRLMKLVDYDERSKLETWKYTNLSSDKPHELNNFMFNGYRICDTLEDKVLRTNLELHRWLQMKASD